MGIEVDEIMKKKMAIELQSRVMETRENDKKPGAESCRCPVGHFEDFGFYSG